MSSIGGVTAFPTVGLYHASKWGLEGLSQSLAAEVAGFGIKVTIVEPGGFATDWSGLSAKRATPMAVYDDARAAIQEIRTKSVRGDPSATGPAILKVVDARDPPLRILFGSEGLRIRGERTNGPARRRILPWSKEDVKNLRSFARAKLSQPQAAKKLGRSRGAVAQKAMKLKIMFRSVRRRAR